MLAPYEKVAAQRLSIQEHVYKWQTYPLPQDKAFAVKTIQNCQKIIVDEKRRSARAIPDSWEDDWFPGKPFTLTIKVNPKSF